MLTIVVDAGAGTGAVDGVVVLDDELAETSGFPLSLSPIFGKSRIVAPQYSGKASLNRG